MRQPARLSAGGLKTQTSSPVELADQACFWTLLCAKLGRPRGGYAKQFQSQPYTHDDWRKYRKATWRHRVEPTVFLHVACALKWQILWVMAVSVAVCFYQRYLPALGWPNLSPTLAASSMSATVTFSLSLLLVFKTNSSYGHFWEGRIAWGNIVNSSRNFMRLVMQWVPEDQPELRNFALRWACAAPHILRVHLQEGHDLTTEMQGRLLDTETAWLLGWKLPLNAAATALSEAIAAADIAPQLVQSMQEQVSVYISMAGVCERIFKTPIPPAYTRHTSRFLMIYLTVAPCMLWSTLDWATPVGSAMLAFLLLGVENISVQIEEPFRVLPLLAMCNGIEANLAEMLLEHGGARLLLLEALAKAPLPPSPVRQYLLPSSASEPYPIHFSLSPRMPLPSRPSLASSRRDDCMTMSLFARA